MKSQHGSVALSNAVRRRAGSAWYSTVRNATQHGKNFIVFIYTLVLVGTG
jgi:hypothetical protein